jgi:hypothetical protein
VGAPLRGAAVFVLVSRAKSLSRVGRPVPLVGYALALVGRTITLIGNQITRFSAFILSRAFFPRALHASLNVLVLWHRGILRPPPIPCQPFVCGSCG